MSGELTLNQMLQAPFIRGVISQLKTPLTAFQQHFKMTPGSNGATERVTGDAIGWDIFNTTRTLAKIKPRGSGPARTAEKPIGHNSATLVRMHDSIHLEQDKIFATRNLGGGWDSPVDIMGQNYFNRQMTFLKQKFANSREFMLSRLFRNGFGVAFSGDDMTFVESTDTNAFSVDYQIPSTNRSQVTMGGSSNIVDGSFDNPSTDIPTILYNLRKNMIRVNGFELKEFWINSTTFTKMQNNNYLAQIAGSANTVFTSINGMTITKEEADAASGFMVQFRALPLFKFFVYDGGGHLGSVAADSTTASDFSLYVPDNVMIGTPEPSSSWIGCAEGSEIVAESYVDPGKHVHGFHTWKNRTILPPGWDLIGVDNWLPILYVPSVVIYATVIF